MPTVTTTEHSATERHRGPADRLHISVTAPGEGVTLCAVAGEIDFYTADVLRSALAGAVDAAARLIVIDLSRVLFFGVAGLHALLEARGCAGHTGRRLRLVTGPRCVERVLQVAGAAAPFERMPNLADAVLDAVREPDQVG